MMVGRSLRRRAALAALVLLLLTLLAAGLHRAGLAPGGYIMAAVISAFSAGLLVLGASHLGARRMAASVRLVAEGARRFAQGDLAHRVQAPASRDTRELAQAFNAMAGVLQDLVQGLSGERDKLSAVLATMADGVVVVDAGGAVLLSNQAATDLLGFTPQQMEGRRLVELTRDYALHQLITRCLNSGEQQHGQIELLRPRRVLSTVATPLRAGGSPGTLLTFHDLTRVQQVETSHREFVSNVSHELRSPLASIKAMVETLEDGALGDQKRAPDFLQRIHRDVDRMTRLVNDLLELSRLESGQLPLELRTVDLLPLLQEVAGQFQERAAAQGVALEVQALDGLPPVQGDPDRLRQVLVNLVDNALKFTPAQGRVAISAGGEGANLVEVRVTDTGFGIAREHLPHVFERFYKAERSRHEGGTGLGLSIVKQIVEALGGQVRVESQEGLGSTFIFTVPRAL
jgi:two-component system phosphate regulon sensor histidine kinase PhoR